jgi:hypothetical protein
MMDLNSNVVEEKVSDGGDDEKMGQESEYFLVYCSLLCPPSTTSSHSQTRFDLWTENLVINNV